MSEQALAIAGIAALAVDCSDPPGLARWWSRLLGGRVVVDRDGDATLHAPGGLAIDRYDPANLFRMNANIRPTAILQPVIRQA